MTLPKFAFCQTLQFVKYKNGTSEIAYLAITHCKSILINVIDILQNVLLEQRKILLCQNLQFIE